MHRMVQASQFRFLGPIAIGGRPSYFAFRVLLCSRRETNADRLSQSFESCSNIHPIAEEIAILNDHISLMNADPKLDALSRWQVAVVLGHSPLQVGCTA